MTDKDRITAAFRALRKLGYTARQNFLCCGSCAMSQLAEEEKQGKDHSKFVTYNQQGDEHITDFGQLKDSLFLYWAGDVKEIVKALEDEGLAVAPHEGNLDLSIEIFAFRPEHGKLADKLLSYVSRGLPKFGAFDDEDFETLPQVLAMALRRAGVNTWS